MGAVCLAWTYALSLGDENDASWRYNQASHRSSLRLVITFIIPDGENLYWALFIEADNLIPRQLKSKVVYQPEENIAVCLQS